MISKPLRIADKLRNIVLLTSGLALLVASVSFIVIDVLSYRQNLVDRIAVISDFVATNTTAALVFEDELTAGKLLDSLDAEKAVQHAVIFDGAWQPFAPLGGGRGEGISRAQLAWQERAPDGDNLVYWMTTTSLYMVRPIVLDQEVIGFLCIEATLSSIYSRLGELLLSILVLWGCVMLGVHYLSRRLQQRISWPIEHLVDGMKQVSVKQDFSLRLEPGSQDEIGTLIDGFNDMLGQVHERDMRLAEHRRELEAANKAKSVFLATMSHEIRTPMNGVLGMAELLYDSKLSDKQRKFVAAILSSGQNLLQLINEILDLSKIEAGRLELESIRFNAGRIVEEVGELLSEQATAKGLLLRCELPVSASLAVQGDPARLRQVLINLAGNAIKFTEQGSVTIRLQHQPASNHQVKLRFDVTDTGIGIDEGYQQRVFDAFSQSDDSLTRRHGGTGLGLSICKQLVELMGGELQLISQPGQGASFYFVLSLTQADEPESTAPDVDASASGSALADVRTVDFQHKHILLAEDNAVNQQVAQGMLERLGCRVSVAANGVDALRILQQEAVDLVLMDCHMPEMDGLEATRQIRQLEAGGERRLPIVALTANALKGYRQRCEEAGMDGYLSKPFTLAALRRVLDDWLNNGGHGKKAGEEPGDKEQAAPVCFPDECVVINDETLECLRALKSANGDDLLGQVIDAYLDTSPQLLAAMHQAVQATDRQQIYLQAHSLKSSSANVGAERLAHCCLLMELEARSAEAGQRDYQRLFGHLEREYRQVRDALALAEA